MFILGAGIGAAAGSSLGAIAAEFIAWASSEAHPVHGLVRVDAVGPPVQQQRSRHLANGTSSGSDFESDNSAWAGHDSDDSSIPACRRVHALITSLHSVG